MSGDPSISALFTTQWYGGNLDFVLDFCKSLKYDLFWQSTVTLISPFVGLMQWDQSNKNYILTHGVLGVDWKHYKHPLSENVYRTYMRYWGDVELAG